MKKNDEPIIIEQTFEASADTVWSAITDFDQMIQWFFPNIPAFKAEVGFQTRFDVRCEDRTFPHMWKITEVQPGKMITYNWKYDGYQGNSFVKFELFEENNQTTLRLTHQATEDFAEDIPEFTRESGIAGWTYFIKQSLKEFLT